MHHSDTKISQRLAEHFEETSVATSCNKTVGRNQYFETPQKMKGDEIWSMATKQRQKHQSLHREAKSVSDTNKERLSKPKINYADFSFLI
jgi:hypothetical protein